MTLARVFPLIILIEIFCMAVRPTTDPDMWWHLRTGELIVTQGIPRQDTFSFTVPGREIIAHEWLSEAYMWLAYISTPKAQAQQATWYGETPVNSKACPIMDQIQAGACAKFHANDPSYLDNIALWKTPLTTCDDGSNNCVPYSQWQQAWTTQVELEAAPDQGRSRPGMERMVT